MSQVKDIPLQAAWEAMDQLDWAEAFSRLSTADKAGDIGAEGLDALGRAGWATGNYTESLQARERAYTWYLKEGNRQSAALMAIMVCIDYILRGEQAVWAGWLSTADRVVKGEPECRATGFVTFVHAQAALLFEKNFDTTLSLSRRMEEMGIRLHDLDVETLGIATQARALVNLGQVEEGIQRIDEAMAIAVSGELDPWATEFIYCNTLCACQALGDYRRAMEWTEAARQSRNQHGIVPTSGHCRVHRAGVLRCQGDWTEAEEEVRSGCKEIQGRDFLHIGWAMYELGEILLRRGNLTAAEEAFQEAHELGRPPQPGMALLRLTQGRIDTAMASIADSLSDDPWDHQPRANLLAAQVEIALAAGDLTLARSAAGEIESTARRFGTSALAATYAFAEGAIVLVDGNPAEAVTPLRHACRLWQEVGIPYETARSRLLLAQAYLARGSKDDAEFELQAARSTFDRLGAAPDARRTNEMLASISEDTDFQTAVAGPVMRTFMFTDIVKSTPLLEAIGDEAWTAVLRWHDESLRAMFARHQGEEVHYTGDGFFVAFEDTMRALECAMAIQGELAEHRRLQGFSPQVRIGLHASDAIRGSSSYQGKGVHTAARIGALAEGGEILVSEAAVARTGGRFVTTEPRTVTLRGVSEPVDVVSVVWR
jgi:class 3 adenylate cyclase